MCKYIRQARRVTQICMFTRSTHAQQVNTCNIDGSTPLCYASAKGFDTIAGLLLSAGAEVNPPLAVTFPPLHEATLGGHVTCVQFLIQSGVDLERSENQFGTALHIACLKGYDNCMRVLLHAGANPDVIKRHQSPLHIAAARGSVECVCLLLQYGADVYKTDVQSRMAVDLTGDPACRRLLLATAGKMKSCLVSIRNKARREKQ